MLMAFCVEKEKRWGGQKEEKGRYTLKGQLILYKVINGVNGPRQTCRLRPASHQQGGMRREWKERVPESIVPLVPCQSMFLLQFRGGASLQFGSTHPLMACDCCVHSWWDARLSKFFRFYTTAAAFLPASPWPSLVQTSRLLFVSIAKVRAVVSSVKRSQRIITMSGKYLRFHPLAY